MDMPWSASQPGGARMLRRWELPVAGSPGSARQARPKRPLHLAYPFDRPAVQSNPQKVSPPGSAIGAMPWSVTNSNKLLGTSKVPSQSLSGGSVVASVGGCALSANVHLYGALTEEGVDAELRRLTALLQALLADVSRVHASVRKLHQRRKDDCVTLADQLLVIPPAVETVADADGNEQNGNFSSCIQVLSDAIGEGLAASPEVVDVAATEKEGIDVVAAETDTMTMEITRMEDSLARTMRRTDDLENARDETLNALAVLARKLEKLELRTLAGHAQSPPGNLALNCHSAAEEADEVVSRAASTCSGFLLEASQMTRSLMAGVGLLDVEDFLPSYGPPFTALPRGATTGM